MPDDDDKLKRRQATEFLSVKLANERRPLLVGSVLSAGVASLRPTASPQERRTLVLAIIDAVLGFAGQPEGQGQGRESKAEARRREALERRFRADPVFTSGEVIRIRTLHDYGMTKPQIAKLFGVETQAIRRVLGKNELVIVPPARTRAKTKRGRRALDVG